MSHHFLRIIGIAVVGMSGLLGMTWSLPVYGFNPAEIKRLWALPVPLADKDESGEDLIRVRVYPHRQKTAAKRAAEPLDHVDIEGACQLFTGTSGATGATSKKLGYLDPGTSTSFHFGLSQVAEPKWLNCTGPVTIKRGAALTSNQYLAAFYLHAVTSNEFGGDPFVEVVAVLPIETYLRGVVPTEIMASWPMEALKTQAVAARSFVYYTLAHHKMFGTAPYFDLDDTNRSQAFSGLSKVHPATDAAVAATRGEVITYRNLVIPAFFDGDHGGQTESAQEVFGFNAPYCPAQPEPAAVAKAAETWSVTIDPSSLGHRQLAAVPAGRQIVAISTDGAQLSQGRRVRQVTALLDDGSKAQVPVAQLRKAVHELKSNLFSVATTNDGDLEFRGRGTGHGVGLSQNGAMILARTGWGYQKILKTYFKDIGFCTVGASASQGGCRAPGDRGQKQASL